VTLTELLVPAYRNMLRMLKGLLDKRRATLRTASTSRDNLLAMLGGVLRKDESCSIPMSRSKS
jgi:hypothetical protein